MSALLERAIEALGKLPEDEQERFGAWILDEISADQRWDELFARSADMLAQMAADALADDEAALTFLLDPAAEPT